MNQHELLDIPRALQAWPKIELIDDREGNQFKAVVWRHQAEQVTVQVTVQVTGEVGAKLGLSRDQVKAQPESLADRVLRVGLWAKRKFLRRSANMKCPASSTRPSAHCGPCTGMK